MSFSKEFRNNRFEPSRHHNNQTEYYKQSSILEHKSSRRRSREDRKRDLSKSSSPGSWVSLDRNKLREDERKMFAELLDPILDMHPSSKQIVSKQTDQNSRSYNTIEVQKYNNLNTNNHSLERNNHIETQNEQSCMASRVQPKLGYKARDYSKHAKYGHVKRHKK